MSDYRRGGFSSPFNTYSTWINNGNIDLTDTTKYRIDGSWLDNGEYGRAFKGIHSKKEVNIFLGAGYTNTSWSSTFLAGGIATAIRGLGLWGLSALFNRNKQPQQTTIQGNINFPFQNYFTNLSGLFKINTPTSTNVTGNIDGGNVDKGNQPDNTKKDIETDPNKKIKDGDNPKDITNATAIGTNSNYPNSESIRGNVKNVVTGDATTNGYPKSFEVHDSTQNGKKGEPQKIAGTSDFKANVYKFVFVRIDESSQKPVYKCESANIYANANDIIFTQNEYIINNGFIKDSNDDTKYTIKEKLEMVTNGTKNTVQKINNFDFTLEQPTTFPPSNN